MRKINILHKRNKPQQAHKRKLCAVITSVLLGLTNTAYGADGDGDTIDDSVDNCLLVANTPQRDTNGDGYGNLCDGDLTGNGVVDYDDVNRTYWYFGTEGDGSYNPDADIDGDGVVNGTDVNFIKAIMNTTGKPGPSAIDYAGSDNPPTIDDDDGDGFENQLDNCIEVANPNQRDTNGNGYGNFWCYSHHRWCIHNRYGIQV